MKKLKILIIIVLSTCFSCSDDFLDVAPQDRISEAAVWTDANLIKAYHNSLYNGIPHGFGRHMISKFSDEAYSNYRDIQRNTHNPDNIAAYGGGDQNYLYFWDGAYQYIRSINIFLEQMANPQVEVPDLERMIGEAKFIRGFIYFELIKRFGGVPLVTKSYSLGEDIDFTRSSFEEVVEFIESDLNEAMVVLPEEYASTSADFGRATQDAVLALKSRLFLYAASPLFNPSDDESKWQRAADAAEELLNRGYSLYPDYRQMFIQESGSENNELIFVRNFSTSNSHQAPIVNINRRYGGYGGWGGSNGPLQGLVDDYDMLNGEPPFIDDDWGERVINPASGYDPQDPYSNRDPRMNATLLHNGSIFRGDVMEMWVAADEQSWGYDSYRQSGDNPRSHYVLKKFIPEDIPLNWSTPYTMPWIHFRLAEIYLNYAEAKFELGDEETARKYINLVRARPSVDLPPIGNDVTGEELRERLYNERRIELAFEGHRFWDVRRWKLSPEELSSPLIGMDIIRDVETGEDTYIPFVLAEREPFEEKMYLMPIETSEILRNPELEQTPGW